MKNLSEEELLNQAAGFSCGCDKCLARVEPPRKELFSRLERGRKAIEAMDEIRRIFDTCPSYKEGKMSEDRIEAIKEFVSFLERKKDVNVSGDLYVSNVNFLLTEIAELRATIVDNGREIDKKNMEIEHWKGLATHGCSNESECCPYYCMNEAAEAELAELRERMKPVCIENKTCETCEHDYYKMLYCSPCQRCKGSDRWQAIKAACEDK